MKTVNRDLSKLVQALIHTARLIPDRQNGGLVILLDPHVYMQIEDMTAYLSGRENLDDESDVRHDVILGETIR